jgi:hypothetical protein
LKERKNNNIKKIERINELKEVIENLKWKIP